jgi:hypothetical protein
MKAMRKRSKWGIELRTNSPPSQSKRGRRPSRLKAQCAPVRVDKWVEQQPVSKWKRTRIRDATKGNLWVDIFHQRVWLWDGEEPHANCWHLIVRRDIETKHIKYSLSNATEETSYKRLASMQAQRYWVERSF